MDETNNVDVNRYLPKYVFEDENDENQLNTTVHSLSSDFTKMMQVKTAQLDINSSMMRQATSQVAKNSFYSQDLCRIPDTLREEILRNKRKEEAYKTALCDSFRRTNACAYGDLCRFAHGVDELRLPNSTRGRNHPKYKTVLCDKFSLTGSCKYGIRCQFIHEVKNPNLLAHTAASFNQSMFAPETALIEEQQQQQQQQQQQHHLSFMDGNMSLPLRQSDIHRAFSRAAPSSMFNESISRITRACDRSYYRFNQPSPFQL